tara:strand:- start:704 stop:1213 length:510 start_codon:yes stop_codon:yes gene_type:complete
MPTLTLTFPNAINDSLQIGDMLYHITTTTQTLSDGGYSYVDSQDGTAYDGSNPPIFYENQSGNATQAYASYGANNTSLVEIGNVTNMQNTRGGTLTTANQIQAYISTTATRPTQYVDASNPGSFIMFSKDARANMSSLMGYYAEVELTCTDTEEAEIFAVNSEVVESSK